MGLPSGILGMWDNDLLQLICASCGEFSITCVFLLVDSGLSWVLTSINRPHSREDKLKFWEELRSIKDSWSGP